MSTDIRASLSKKNQYWLPKHRFYELRHFCLQYPEWKSAYIRLDESLTRSSMVTIPIQHNHSDPTAVFAEVKVYYRERLDMVQRTAKAAADDLYSYLLEAVTEGLSYEALNSQKRIPCCKDTWYVMYRRFFWLLDKERK